MKVQAMNKQIDPYAAPADANSAGKYVSLPRTPLEWVVIGAICLILVALLLPPVQSVHTPARRTMCKNNLKQIGLALHNYHDAYNCFPPAVVHDEHGQPAHSWRVLILPFMEEQALYDLYRFDEPWNGPNNSKLLDSMPAVFACPSFRNSTFASAKDANHLTTYMAISDSGAAFDGPTAHRIQQFSDDISNTIMVTEVRRFANVWLAPGDVSISQFITELRESKGSKIGHHKDGIHILIGDGSARFLPHDTAETTLDQMTSISGNNDGPAEF